jgi:hypothetical protein
MDSPFPGMDPYLESHCGDVHTRIVMYVCDQIQEELPSDLVARVEESVTVDMAEESRMVAPDVLVSETPAAEMIPKTSGAATVAEPLVVLEEVPQTARHVKIVDLSHGEQVVTVIEVLSPTNKMTMAGREEYRRKQREYILAGVNLVEIDLLRRGQHVLSAAWELIPPEKRRTYMISVRTRSTNVSLWGIVEGTIAHRSHSAATSGPGRSVGHPGDHRPGISTRSLCQPELSVRSRSSSVAGRCCLGRFVAAIPSGTDLRIDAWGSGHTSLGDGRGGL